MGIVRYYIADDHKLLLDSLKLLLSNDANYVCVGSTTHGDIALMEIFELQPDLAILDIRMPGKDGLALTNLLKIKMPWLKILIISMFNEAKYIKQAKEYGADGYVLKNTGHDELKKAIDTILKGKKYFKLSLPENQEQNTNFFTPREKEILGLIIGEFSNKEIADKLVLSIHTVNTHRKNLMKKTNTKNVAGLIKYVLDNKIEINS